MNQLKGFQMEKSLMHQMTFQMIPKVWIQKAHHLLKQQMDSLLWERIAQIIQLQLAALLYLDHLYDQS
jgi:hypothetical protein